MGDSLDPFLDPPPGLTWEIVHEKRGSYEIVNGEWQGPPNVLRNIDIVRLCWATYPEEKKRAIKARVVIMLSEFTSHGIWAVFYLAVMYHRNNIQN